MKVMHAPYSYKIVYLSRFEGALSFYVPGFCQGFAVKSGCSVQVSQHLLSRRNQDLFINSSP